MNTDPTNQNQTTTPKTTGSTAPNRSKPAADAGNAKRTTARPGGALSAVSATTQPTAQPQPSLSQQPIIPQDLTRDVPPARATATPPPTPPSQHPDPSPTKPTQTPAQKQATAMPRPQSILHTYKGDVENLVKKQKLSLMQMAAAQADAPKKQLRKLNPHHRSSTPTTINVPLLAGALTLLGLLALGISYSVFFAAPPAPPPVPKSDAYRFFFADKTETVDLTDKNAVAIKRMLTTLRDSSWYPKGSVVHILPVVQQTDADAAQTRRPLSTEQWLAQLAPSLPKTYRHVFAPVFMFGWYADGERNHPYLVLRTTDYDTAFAGMLAWEKDMEADLFPLFSLRPQDPSIQYGSDNTFTDAVVHNIDVRMRKDADGNVQLIYGFISKDTLLLTTDIVPFVEIARRLRTAQ